MSNTNNFITEVSAPPEHVNKSNYFDIPEDSPIRSIYFDKNVGDLTLEPEIVTFGSGNRHYSRRMLYLTSKEALEHLAVSPSKDESVSVWKMTDCNEFDIETILRYIDITFYPQAVSEAEKQYLFPYESVLKAYTFAHKWDIKKLCERIGKDLLDVYELDWKTINLFCSMKDDINYKKCILKYHDKPLVISSSVSSELVQKILHDIIKIMRDRSIRTRRSLNKVMTEMNLSIENTRRGLEPKITDNMKLAIEDTQKQFNSINIKVKL